MKCQRITLMTTEGKHRLDNGKSHCERGSGGIPYLSSSDLNQGTFSMDVGFSIVKGRVEVKEIARKKKCAYLDYHRQQVKKIQRKNLGNIFAHEEDLEFQKSRQEEEQKDMVEPQKCMVMVLAKVEMDAPISSTKD
jgi:hypothetical protein